MRDNKNVSTRYGIFPSDDEEMLIAKRILQIDFIFSSSSNSSSRIRKNFAESFKSSAKMFVDSHLQLDCSKALSREIKAFESVNRFSDFIVDT